VRRYGMKDAPPLDPARPRDDDSAAVLRRLVALQRIPLFADLAPSIVSTLAEHAGDRPVAAGEPLANEPGTIRFFPGGADAAGLPRGTDDLAAHAPELLPYLAGQALDGKVRARADGLAVHISAAHLASVLEDEFSLFLAITEALAADVVRLANVPLVGSDRADDRNRADAEPAGRLDLTDRVLSLQSALPFAKAHVGSLVQLARHAAELRADAGMELWREGDASTFALVIVRGAVRARTVRGVEFPLGPGTLVGGPEALARAPRWFTAAADGALLALTLPLERFLDVLEDEPELARELLRSLAARLLGAQADHGP
jgi:hypothetical protein